MTIGLRRLALRNLFLGVSILKRGPCHKSSRKIHAVCSQNCIFTLGGGQEGGRLQIRIRTRVRIRSWVLAASWPRWRPGKAAAADQDPDQGEDPQLDPRCLVARAAPRKAAAADLDPDQGEDPQLDPRCLAPG